MTETKKSNRFDLEQDILECWKVVNDMQLYVEQNSSISEFTALADYYEHKFNRLWSTFESMIHERKM